MAIRATSSTAPSRRRRSAAACASERERRGISLRELARRVGVSPSLVSQIELDRVNPSVSTLYSLVTELGMTMSDVFGDADAPDERVVRRASRATTASSSGPRRAA